MKTILTYALLSIVICSCNNEGISNSERPLDLIKIRVTSKGPSGNRIDSVVIDKESLRMTKYNFSLDRKDSSSVSKTIPKNRITLVNEMIQKESDSTLIFNLCTTSREYLINQDGKTTVIEDNSCGLDDLYRKIIE